MNFNFFTFGGAVFWEDVFFYQKWRIQRNCITKRYRLLDSWDIRRASGTFETCQQAFIACINCYEIPHQKGDMIILLHGYADSKNIFKPLWRKLMLTHANVAALNYPSLFRNAQGNAHQIAFFLNHVESINKVSFVTKGYGNLVLQQLFNLPSELQTFRQNMKIGNIVELNPVEKSNSLCKFLLKFRFLHLLFGPALQDFAESRLKHLPGLPSEINTLKIFTKFANSNVLLKYFNTSNFNVPDKKRTIERSITAKNIIFSPLQNEQVLNFTVKFINNGKL